LEGCNFNRKLSTKKSPKKVVTKNKTPYELWYGKQPNLSYLRNFGCKEHGFVHEEKN